jgi:ParB/RepB/Spo0J family partition protein
MSIQQREDKELEVVLKIPLADIERHPLNRIISPESAAEMAELLKQTGQVTPAILRPHNGKLQLLAGERRFEGCKLAGIEYLEGLVREMSDTQAVELMLIENLKRQNLTELEEAQAYEGLLSLRDEKGNRLYRLEDIAIKVHCDIKQRSRVAQIHKLIDLPEVAKQALKDEVIGVRQAFLVARIRDPRRREKAAKEVISHPTLRIAMPVPMAQQWISERYQVSLRGAPFDKEDISLVAPMCNKSGEREAGGLCGDCPNRAGVALEGTGELAKQSRTGGSESGVDPNTCFEPSCFHKKVEETWQRGANKKAEEGWEILPISETKEWFSVATKEQSEDPARAHEALSPMAPVIALEAKAMRYSDEPSKAPTWGKLLHATGVPIALACGPGMTPVKVADKKLAIAAIEQAHPELALKTTGMVSLKEEEVEELKKEATATGVPLVQLVDKAAKRKQEEATRERELAKIIDRKAKCETLKALQAGIREHRLDALEVLWERTLMAREANGTLEAYLGLPDNATETQLIRYPTNQRMEPDELLALCVIGNLMDDYFFSGESAKGMKELLKVCKVNPTSILAKVKKEQEAAEKERLQAAEEKEKTTRKKTQKSSTDPVDWTPEKEAAKVKAADKQAKKKTGGQGEEGTGREEKLVSCEKCGIGNFTERGLKAHKCRDGWKRHYQDTDVTSWLSRLLQADVKEELPNANDVYEKPLICALVIDKKTYVDIRLSCDSTLKQWSAGYGYTAKDRSGGGLPAVMGLKLTRAFAVEDELERLLKHFGSGDQVQKITNRLHLALGLLKELIKDGTMALMKAAEQGKPTISPGPKKKRVASPERKAKAAARVKGLREKKKAAIQGTK